MDSECDRYKERFHELTPEREAMRRQLIQKVHEALATLETNLRAVAYFRYIAELTVWEIAHVMGRPVNTVNVWAFKARQLMRARLEEQGIGLDHLYG